MVVSIIAIEAVVCGMASAPVLLYWLWLVDATANSTLAVRVVVFSVSLIPSYALFALCLMAFSVAAARTTGMQTPSRVEMQIADFDWPVLAWARSMAAIHVVRVFAGTLFRGSPIWTAYLRLNGARIGRRVYVNTTSISDHNLLEFGDDVVIGADVHISGHTVERGLVKTAPVRLGHRVTIGLGSIIDIDVEVGDDCQVGAISLVPKHTKLEAGSVYAGIPVKRIA